METYPAGAPLMTCRYCILYELGHCRKLNPYPKDKEPRYLRLKNGTIIAVEFDCKDCQMLLYGRQQNHL